MDRKFAKRCGLLILPSDSQVHMAQTSFHSAVKGECIVDFTLNGVLYSGISVCILDNLCADVILGREFMKKHKSVKFNFGGSLPELTLPSVVSACSVSEVSESPAPDKSTMNVPHPALFENLTPDCKPIAIKSKRKSAADTRFIRNEVEKLLQEGRIQPSTSPWRAQVLLTPDEPNHRKRMVVDYSRTINRFTELDAYPLPRIDEQVQEVSTYKYYSTYDLKSAYHQVSIREEDRKYTAFEADGGLYEFTVVPFGLTNGVPAFQRLMHTAIKNEDLDATFAFLDNITVCGNSLDELTHNEKQFEAMLKKYNMMLNHTKTLTGQTSIPLLGHIVSHGEIKPDPERLTALMEMAPPHNEPSQKRVTGMFAHYSRWIPNFSSKIRHLTNNKIFPPSQEVVEAFETLKKDLKEAALRPIDPSLPFLVETDASTHTIAASLSQDGRPVAFYSRTLNQSEVKHHSVEKEAYAIVESLKTWRHFLIGKEFDLITDQRSVAFMFDNRRHGKIKNDKIIRWRIELSDFRFNIKYRPGTENACADALSRETRVHSCAALLQFPFTTYSREETLASTTNDDNKLHALHDALCHPGVARMHHFVKSRNLPYSVADIKRTCDQCSICRELKPCFYKSSGKLIHATRPLERLNIDFKGPLPSTNQYRYFLTVVDEYSRFPFAFPCKDMTSSTVVACLQQLFSMYGLPGYVHSDRAPDLIGKEVKTFLTQHGVATSRTSPYNPKGNGQCERYNGVIWKTVLLALKSRGLPTSAWQEVLPTALHSIRSLLCTSTNCTPHERMFLHQRRTATGDSIPTWLTKPGPVFLRKHARRSKYEPVVQEVELLEANPEYAHVRFENGRESTVSLRDLAPHGDSHPVETSTPSAPSSFVDPDLVPAAEVPVPVAHDEPVREMEPPVDASSEKMELRRSGRASNPPRRFVEEY